MTERIACTSCGALILPSTAEKSGGLCMPCKGGYRKNIEDSKLRYEAEKKERETPPHKHWGWLVNQVHGSSEGFAGLSPANQRYFAACLVNGEVYNGGFDQYFFNSSADYYACAKLGLFEMGATESCRLLEKAKQVAFGNAHIPKTQAARVRFLRASAPSEKQQMERSKKLDELDRLYWKDPDNFPDRSMQFAQKHGLFDGF